MNLLVRKFLLLATLISSGLLLQACRGAEVILSPGHGSYNPDPYGPGYDPYYPSHDNNDWTPNPPQYDGSSRPDPNIDQDRNREREARDRNEGAGSVTPRDNGGNNGGGRPGRYVASYNIQKKYQISKSAADILTDTVLRINAGDLSAIQDLGISPEDSALMQQGQNPSASGLVSLSTKLGLSLVETHLLIQKVKADVSQ